MLIGAFVDAGASLENIVARLQTLPIGGWTIECTRVTRKSVAAVYVDVTIPGEDDHRDHPDAHRHPPGRRLLRDVLDIFERSSLSPAQKALSRQIAVRLAESEAATLGVGLAELRFHAVGQVDAVIDIAGTAIALELLGIERVFCSAFPVGLRLPGETARLLAGAPTRSEKIDAEMVTTTGAAILTTLVAQPGLRPALARTSEGYGAGRSDFPIPNVTRVEVGELLNAPSLRSG
jgi:uncharacterized protein (DUF111 family)